MLLHRLIASATLIAVLANTAAAAHDGGIHTGLTTTALAAMEQMDRASSGSVKQIPPAPAGVAPAEWQKFYLDAGVALKNLRTIADNNPDHGPGLEKILAEYSANIPDNNTDDTHMWFKLDSALGFGTAKSVVDEAMKGVAAVTVVPLYCACACVLSLFHIGHKCSDCLHGAKNLIDKLPTTGDLTNWIPGVGDINPSAFTGLWHFIDMNPGMSNQYDDHQGMLYTQSGPLGLHGSVDLLLIALSDISGMSVHGAKSNGVTNYQRVTPHDSFPDGDRYDGSIFRSNNEWQSYPFAHTPFSPADNLALYGWTEWRKKPSDLTNLGYPVHALGDATVPMHVNDTTSWGHRPFEDGYDHLWNDHKINLDPDEVIRAAFFYRREILAWRAPGSTDVPIRHLVREVAEHTWTYSAGKMLTTVPPWPFNDPASLEHFPADLSEASVLGAIGNGVDMVYEARPDAVALVKPLLIDGASAILALLVSAADQPATLPGGATAFIYHPSAAGPVASPIFGQVSAQSSDRGLASRTSPQFPIGRFVRDPAPTRDTPDRDALAKLAAQFLEGDITAAQYASELAKFDAANSTAARPNVADTGRERGDDRLARLRQALVDQQSRSDRSIRALTSRMTILYAPQCADQLAPATPAPGKFGVGLYATPGKAQVTFSINHTFALKPTCPVFFVMEVGPSDQGVPPVSIAVRDNEARVSPDGTLLWFNLDDNGTLPDDRVKLTTLIANTGLSKVRYRMQAVNSIGDHSAWTAWQTPVSVLKN